MNPLLRAWAAFLARRHPLTEQPLTLSHQRIYILPSRQGLGLAVLLLASLISAINYQLSLGFFFVFLLVGIAHAAMLHTYCNLPGLRLRPLPGEPTFAGESAYFPLLLSETRGRSRHGLTFILQQGAQVVCAVPAHGETRTALPLPTTRRGRLQLPRSRIECRTPSGWFVAWSYLWLSSECLVYPAPELAPPPLPHGALDGGGGARNAQGDDDFAGLRDYLPGDIVSRIAWRQSARSDVLLAKTFQSPQANEILLDWFTLSGLDAESRLSRLTAWVLQAEAAGHLYALRLPELSLPPAHGPTHRHACLSALALFPPDAST